MAFTQVIPFAEAAIFTVGCAVLRTKHFDPERAGVLLMATIALLVFSILIVATETGTVSAIPEPDEVRSVFE